MVRNTKGDKLIMSAFQTHPVRFCASTLFPSLLLSYLSFFPPKCLCTSLPLSAPSSLSLSISPTPSCLLCPSFSLPLPLVGLLVLQKRSGLSVLGVLSARAIKQD